MQHFCAYLLPLNADSCRRLPPTTQARPSYEYSPSVAAVPWEEHAGRSDGPFRLLLVRIHGALLYRDVYTRLPVYVLTLPYASLCAQLPVFHTSLVLIHWPCRCRRP